MDKVFLITTVSGDTLPATNVRTFEDRGEQQLALIYKSKLKTLKAADVAAVSFGAPPAATEVQA